jgi:hypothetical protein
MIVWAKTNTLSVTGGWLSGIDVLVKQEYISQELHDY